MTKRDLRRQMLARRDALTSAEILERSTRGQQRLMDLPGLESAACAMLYASCASEVRTRELARWALEQGKQVVLPKVQRDPKGLLLYKVTAPEDQLQAGPLGIPEPDPDRCEAAAIDEVDFVVAPGVAFDERGVRLGQGGGYYDRFLARLRRRADHPPVVGAAFELQIIERVPVEPHDARVNLIVTEERVLRVASTDAHNTKSDE